MLVDGNLSFMVVGASQDGNVVPALFTWEVDDPVLANVDETEPGSATVTGVRRGDTKLIVKSADRGIKIEIPLSVHNVVKGIVIERSESGVIKNGSTTTVMAQAYDAKLDKITTFAAADAEGNEVRGVTFMWTTTNASVATVDASGDNQSPTIKTHGVGSAKIQAHIGDVKSNEITIDVFDVEKPQRRIIPLFNTPHVATINAVDDTSTANVNETATVDDITINVQVQEYVIAEGELTWANAGENLTVTFASLNQDVLELATAQKSAQTNSTGQAQIIIPTSSTAGTAKKAGSAIIKISHGGLDKYVTVTINSMP